MIEPDEPTPVVPLYYCWKDNIGTVYYSLVKPIENGSVLYHNSNYNQANSASDLTGTQTTLGYVTNITDTSFKFNNYGLVSIFNYFPDGDLYS